MVPIHDWLTVVMQNANEQEHLYWEVVKEYLQHGHIMFVLDNTKTTAVLSSTPKPVVFPIIDGKFLRRLWKQATFAS